MAVTAVAAERGYRELVARLSELVVTARGKIAHSANVLMTVTYWEFGRQIVEFELRGQKRAGYGEELIARLAADLTAKYGRGFGRVNLSQMKRFYLAWPPEQIFQTASEKCGETRRETLVDQFRLPWSHYVRLLTVENVAARHFYEAEALRAGWSVRQLDRQIATQFFERAAGRRRDRRADQGDALSADRELRDPFILEFLDLPDEHSEHDLETALLRHLESFLLELGDDFAFVGRQRRLRLGDVWYRIDLLCFHRRLRALLVIDLKIGRFTHADAGQMHVYLNYAREHWVKPGENPPVGLILCSERNDALARYALEGLPNQVLAREYRLALPDEGRLAAEIERTRLRLQSAEDRNQPIRGKGTEDASA